MALCRLKSALATGPMPDLLRNVGTAFILRIAGAGLAFLLNVAIGRLLGASGAGLYFLSLSVISIAAVVSRLGLENTVLRFVASFSDADDWSQVRGMLRYAMGWVGCISLVLSCIILLLADWLEFHVFNAAGMASVLTAAGFAVFCFNVMILFSEALKGLGQTRNAMLVGGVLYPLTALIVIYPAISLFGAAGAGLAYMLGTLSASLVGLIFWKTALTGKPSATPVNRAKMRASSRPLWGMTIMHFAIIPWTPLVLLGFWASPSDVGIFGAASRVAILVSFFLVAVNAVIGPRFSAFYARGETEKIAQLASSFSRLMTIVITPLTLAIFALSSQVMGLFGEDFAQSGAILSILVCGQVINGVTGPVEFILMMSGRERSMRNIVFISMLVMLTLSVLFIPVYGGLGAAIASATAAATTGILSLIAVHFHFGFWVSPFYLTNPHFAEAKKWGGKDKS